MTRYKLLKVAKLRYGVTLLEELSVVENLINQLFYNVAFFRRCWIDTYATK